MLSTLPTFAQARTTFLSLMILRPPCHTYATKYFPQVLAMPFLILEIPRFLQNFRGIWPMPLSLLNHSALALFAQRTRIPTSARSIGFCAIWVCISSSSSSAQSDLFWRIHQYVAFLLFVDVSLQFWSII